MKDFLAPSWLVGLFQKKETDSLKEEGDAKLEKEHANQTDTNEEILNRETFNEQETHVAVRKPIDKIKIGNGQLQTSRGSFSTYSYYSPNLQRQKMVNDFPSTSWQTDLDILEERRRFSREDRNDSRSFAAEPGSEQESSSYGLRDEVTSLAFIMTVKCSLDMWLKTGCWFDCLPVCFRIGTAKGIVLCEFIK